MFLRRLNQTFEILNVVLVAVAIGLATLDATLAISQWAIAHAPPITHIPDPAE